jgi:hypothetical protein
LGSQLGLTAIHSSLAGCNIVILGGAFEPLGQLGYLLICNKIISLINNI